MRRIVACYFGKGAGDQWPRLAAVFAHTARMHCPAWRLELDVLPEPVVKPGQSPAHVANTAKLEYWCDVVERAADGDELLLIDVDTAILKPLDDIWDQPFDVAYTERAKGWRHPLNGGVVFVRATPPARAFVAGWRDENRRMATDKLYHREWRKRYAGINQAAFGALLERPGCQGALQLRAIPCQVWNCEDSTWTTFDPDVTRVLHVKSGLRRAIFGLGGAMQPFMKRLVKLWRQLEVEVRCEREAV